MTNAKQLYSSTFLKRLAWSLTSIMCLPYINAALAQNTDPVKAIMENRRALSERIDPKSAQEYRQHYVDSSGLEWLKCPLRATGEPSCPAFTKNDVLLTYFQAVEAVRKLGSEWRLPDVSEFRQGLAGDLDRRLIARGAGNLRCGDYIFKEISTVLGVPGIFWSAKLYISSDKTIYRTKELMADAIDMDQVPNCINTGGYYPVYGFNAELVNHRYLAYAVRDTQSKVNANWERTANLVMNDRAKLESQNALEKENEVLRQQDDRQWLAEKLKEMLNNDSQVPVTKNSQSSNAASTADEHRAPPRSDKRSGAVQILKEFWSLKDEEKSITIRCPNGAEKAYSYFPKTGRYCTPLMSCNSDQNWIHRALCY